MQINDFLLSLSSLTTLLSPFMVFIFFFVATLFLFQMRDKINKMEEYMKSINQSLKHIANHLSKDKLY